MRWVGWKLTRAAITCDVQGCFQYYLYNHLFVQWCKPITAAVGHLGAAPIKTFIDQCIQ